MKILIIGAGYAGMVAALRLAGKTRNVEITLVNAVPNFLQRIRFHELATGKNPRKHDILKMIRGKRIQFVQGHITSIDPSQHEVTAQTAQGAQRLSYDKLVYALGSYVDMDAMPGAREHAFSLGSADAAQQLLAKLRQNPTARVILCGGGLTGIELATEIAETFPTISLTLLTRDPLGPNLSQRGYAYIRKTFDRLNVTVREGVTVERVLPDGVITTDGTHIRADFTIWAGSFTVSPLARESGLAVNRVGQILVDPYLRSTSHPDVFAAGDTAASGLRMACATAMPIGAHAADNVAALANNQPLQPFRFGFIVRCISLGRRAGLVQLVKGDDSPREQIITGRIAAFIKEMICRYTVDGIYWTRWFPNAVFWAKPAEPTIAPARSTQHA